MQFLFFLVLPKIVAILLGIAFFRLLPRLYVLLLFQSVLALICESYGYYLGDILHQNNVWIFYYYTLIECWLIGIVGYQLLKKNSLQKVAIMLLFICTIIWLYDLMSLGIKIMSNRFLVSYGIVTVLIYIGVLSTRAFETSSLLKNPIFWISVSFILYFGCTIPYFGLWNYLIDNSMRLANSLFNILLVLNIIRYPLIGLSFYLYGKQYKEKLQSSPLSD